MEDVYKRQALDSVDELETDLDQSKESMYKLSYVIRVSAPDLDELKRRCCLLYTSETDPIRKSEISEETLNLCLSADVSFIMVYIGMNR